MLHLRDWNAGMKDEGWLIIEYHVRKSSFYIGEGQSPVVCCLLVGASKVDYL